MFYTLFRLLSPFLPKLLHILRNQFAAVAAEVPIDAFSVEPAHARHCSCEHDTALAAPKVSLAVRWLMDEG